MKSTTHPRPYLPYYLYTGLWSFNATSGLWILYLLHCHWTLFEVGLAESGFHIVSFLANVPTGAVADRFGRRTSIAAGLGIGSVMPLATFLLAPVSVPWGILSISLGALSWTFIGGADEALLYDLAKAEGQSGHYADIYGRAMGLSLSSQAAAIALGGLLAASGQWLWPYALTVATSFLALFAVGRLQPGTRILPAGAPRKHSLTATMRQGLQLARSDRRIMGLVALGAVIDTIATTSSLYAQAMLKHKGAALILITAVLSTGTLLAAASSVLGGRLARRHRRRRFSSQLALYGTALASIGLFPLTGAASAYLSSIVIDSSMTPLYETLLAEASPEDYRATILSLTGTGFSFGMILFFPFAGYLMARGLWIEFYILSGLIPMAVALRIWVGGWKS